MRYQLPSNYKWRRTSPLCALFVLSGLLTLTAVPFGLLGTAAQAARDSGAEAAAPAGCSPADFKAPVTFGVGGNQFARGFPTDIALGDFNGDGRADVAVTHQGQAGVSPTISIALDNGAGGYTAVTPISYWPASVLYRLVAADFNKDGRADVAAVGVISSPFSHVVSVSLSNPDGTFGPPNDITGFFGQTPYDIAAGEFNADGNTDLVVVSGGSQNYSVLFGNGAGGFSFAAVQPVGTRFDRVAVADFDGDAKQDFAITDYDDKRVVILRNNDNGLFGVTQTVTLTVTPLALAAADFNGDNKPDLAIAGVPNTSSNLPTDEGYAAVLLNDGAGGFAAPVYYKAGPAPKQVLTADFDGDGKPDLAVASGGTSREPAAVYVLSGDGAGAFSNAAAHPFAGAHTAVAARDLDGDGRADIAGVVGTGILEVLYGNAPAALPCLLVDDAAVTEGNSGTTNAAVTVRLSHASSQEVSVSYQLAGLTAAEGQDFTGGSGTLTFAPGETAKDVNVSVTADIVDELDESITVQLTNPSNARLSDAVAKLVITDDELQPSISINDVSVAEGDNQFSPGQAVFTVSLSAPSGLVVHVDYSTAAGTATAGTDFSLPSGTLFFAPGTTSKTVSVAVGGDRTFEPDETFFVNLANAGDATIADAQGQGTILNDDPLPSVTILNATGSEAAAASGGTVSMSVRLSNPSTQTVTVKYATADASAVAGSDYAAASGTVTFAPGETEKSITLSLLDDAVDEDFEEFLVNLSDPANATVADGQASCQILDNDGPAVSINDVSVFEGHGGRTLATFTLSLSAPSPQGVSVRASTANGTAVSNSFPIDFQTAANRPVFFAPGTTTATFTVFIFGDIVIEPDETFFVNLSQPSEGTIADGQGVGTITNDDVTSVQFSTSALSVNEGAGSVQATVTRVGDTSGPLTAVYGTFDDLASERSDYTAAYGTLRFGPGETTKTITVFITDDALAETPEPFFIVLGGLGGGATNEPSLLTVTINSDDATDGPNPVNDSTFFVRQHYRDFLGRDPDPEGLAFWVGEIESCGADAQCREVKRVNVSAAFFLSIEFQNTGYLVERMYKTAYGDTTGVSRLTGSPVNIPVPVLRRPDFLNDAGAIREGVVVNVGDWEKQLEANKEAFALAFVRRQLFRDTHPTTLSPAAFVAALNQNTGGALTQAEADALAAEFGGASDTGDEARRASVFRKVAENAEFDRRERNRAFVLMQFFGYLQREPHAPPDFDHTGWKFWLDKLNQFNGNFVEAEMVKAFLSADEYRKRFGQ